ncbi:MAG: flagellar basal body-associated FliL family protein [Treponemataceae bacterium]|jgi:flagellar FliL protein|nr:flagellar basal body-associated FliL family protein [Spirochaetaceae bacterium]MEE0879295.1 flagellar basal body-associated FliL family protein [Treponemataceae bacterium]
MADEDTSLDDNDLGSSTGNKKKGKGMGGLLPTLLKWIAIVIGAIILIVTVVIITMKVMGTNNTATVAVPVSPEYTSKRELLSWYNSIGSIKTKTCDEVPASVIVEVVLGYKVDDKTTATEITQRQIEIKDFLRRYFTGKTAAELRPNNEAKLQMEIRNTINDDILSTSRIKDVKFLTLDVLEQ